jgi:hypothetical protein
MISQVHLGSDANSTMNSAGHPSEYEIFFLRAEIAAALWVHIQSFEVTLRNFIYTSLRRIASNQYWWEIPGLLRSSECAYVQRNIERMSQNRIHITAQSIADNLSLSFWIKLLGKRYHETIWLKIIKHMPVYPGRREDFYNKAREIRNLRNSIAHHGPILRRNLFRDHAYLGELTAILDPHLAYEVEKRSRVLDLLLDARLVGSGGGI